MNAGVAKGVITSVRDDHGQQRVDVRYDDGTVRQALPKSQFKVLEEPQSAHAPRDGISYASNQPSIDHFRILIDSVTSVMRRCSILLLLEGNLRKSEKIIR